MNAIYICQDGFGPSGVGTYGMAFLRRFPEARMLLLNAAEAAPLMQPALRQRIEAVGSEKSHGPFAVVQTLDWLQSSFLGRVLVLPNTGDTPWSATAIWLNRLSAERRANVRVLGIVHSDMEAQYAIAERFFPVTPVWIGVSRRCAAELRRRIGARGARVHELPYPIQTESDVIRETPQSGILRIAYVGRIEEPQKRVSRLAALFAGLIEAGVDFSAAVAGDGPAREEFTSDIGRGGETMARRVALVGTLDPVGVKRLWRTHDICLLTSAFEGMPLALLEAMAAGVCPVVMAVESGLPELLQDGVNARVVPQGDVSAMVAVLTELAADPAQIARLGAAARATVHDRFSPETHFRRLAEIIDELWTLPPPDPAAVPPDPVGAAVAAMVSRLHAAGRPVAVFGAGMFGRKVVDACFATGLEVVALADSDPARRGWNYRGLACVGPEGLVSSTAGVIAIGSMQFATEMQQRMEAVFRAHGFTCPEMVTAGP